MGGIERGEERKGVAIPRKNPGTWAALSVRVKGRGDRRPGLAGALVEAGYRTTP